MQNETNRKVNDVDEVEPERYGKAARDIRKSERCKPGKTSTSKLMTEASAVVKLTQVGSSVYWGLKVPTRKGVNFAHGSVLSDFLLRQAAQQYSRECTPKIRDILQIKGKQ